MESMHQSTESRFHRSSLDQLESEAIHVLREVAAVAERPVLLFSGGKDSVVLSALAQRAFLPGRVPFALLHIDTGHNFPELLTFRDQWCAELNVELVVRTVQASIDAGRVHEEPDAGAGRNHLQSVTLLDAVAELGITCAIGGARRDEEKARAKERLLSFRTADGQWDPRDQRPELWDLFNMAHGAGEHFRAFPLSNWTELDIWHYIRREGLPLPPLYFSHSRTVFRRDELLLAVAPCNPLREGEVPENLQVRFRTLGDMSCSGACESTATTVDEVIREIANDPVSERGGRADDLRSWASMEDRKREGYF